MELPNEADHDVTVTWDQYESRQVRVTMVRCLFCGALDATQRIWREKHKDDKSGGNPGALGGAIAADGRVWIAHEPE